MNTKTCLLHDVEWGNKNKSLKLHCNYYLEIVGIYMYENWLEYICQNNNEDCFRVIDEEGNWHRDEKANGW